jgi:hypothetical protein
MQFFLLDLALAFDALLGYRALAAVAGRSAPVVALGPNRPVRAGTAPTPKRNSAPQRGSPPDCGLSHRDGCCERRAPLHRLVNLW